jgi:hypothetical protein
LHYEDTVIGFTSHEFDPEVESAVRSGRRTVARRPIGVQRVRGNAVRGAQKTGARKTKKMNNDNALVYASNGRVLTRLAKSREWIGQEKRGYREGDESNHGDISVNQALN